MYKIVLSKKAVKDIDRLKQAKLDDRAKELLGIMSINPFQVPPPYESLVGNLKGFYSRRISYKHRLVYEVYEEEKVVHILRMWTHYEI